MALPLGKLTILVGAGILGSVLAKEGRVSDLVSGAFKVAWKQIIRNDHAPAVKKPHNDSLMAQMNNLRQELQIMASSRPVTIVSTSRTGRSGYAITIVVIVVGCGYCWWKGWKFPMFATRRSLSDACSSVSSQLENVYSSVSATKRQLSSQMDHVERGVDECLENDTRSKEEVVEIKGKADAVSTDFRKVQHAVLTLETKLNRIEGKQGGIAKGVWKLCDYALSLEKSGTAGRIQASPSSSSRQVPELPPAFPSSLVTPPQPMRPALELPPSSPSRTGSLPPVFESEEYRCGYNGFQKENNGILEAVESSNRGEGSNGFGAPEGTSNVASSSGRFGVGFGIPTFNTTTILRTRSAASGMVQQKRSTSQQF